MLARPAGLDKGCIVKFRGIAAQNTARRRGPEELRMPPSLGLIVNGAAPQPGARLRVSAALMARLDYRDDDPKDKDRYYDEMDAVTPTPACIDHHPA